MELTIVGWGACPYFVRATKVALAMQDVFPSQVTVHTKDTGSKPTFKEWLGQERDTLGLKGDAYQQHTSSPFCYSGKRFIGGSDALLALFKDDYSLKSTAPLHLEGWGGCPSFQRAARCVEAISLVYPAFKPAVTASESKDQYMSVLAARNIPKPSSEPSPTTDEDEDEAEDDASLLLWEGKEGKGVDWLIACMSLGYEDSRGWGSFLRRVRERLGNRYLDSLQDLQRVSKMLLLEQEAGGCVRLFVAGDRSHCGKTTVCLGVLGSLLAAGVPAARIGYIKPATQCEAPDVLGRWCEANGVEHVVGKDAPIVFFKGFTRAFMDGGVGTSEQLLADVTVGVDRLCQGKSFVLIDGVGFPGVGSVVGASNAKVALASRAPVMIVGKSGVGGAIDAYTLNSQLFRADSVPLLGNVLNRGATEGFYAWPHARRYMDKHLLSSSLGRELCYGVLPELAGLKDVREKVADMPASQVLEVAQMNIDHVIKYMDVASLLLEAASDTWNRRRRALSMPAPSTLRPTNNTNAASSLKRSPASVPSMTREEKRLKVQTELRERGESTKTG